MKVLDLQMGPDEFYRPGDPAWFRNQPHIEIYVPGDELYKRDQNVMRELRNQLEANRRTQGILFARNLIPIALVGNRAEPLDRPWTEIVGAKQPQTPPPARAA